MSSENSYKVIFLGDSNVGKTSIILRICNQWCNVNPTVSADHYPIVYNEQRILFCDTAGQEKYRSLVPIHLRGAVVAVIVYDISDINSFNSIREFYNMSQEFQDTKVIIVGNKSDLEPAVSEQEVKQLANELNCEYLFTCAILGKNIDNLLANISALIKSNDEIPTTNNNPEPNDNESKNCC